MPSSSGPGDAGDGSAVRSVRDLGGMTGADRQRRIVELVSGRPERPYTVGELAAELVEWLDEANDGMTPTEEEVHETLFEFDLPDLHEQEQVYFEPETGRVFDTGFDGRDDGSADAERSDAGAQSLEYSVSRTSVVSLAVLLVATLGVLGATTGQIRPEWALVPPAGVVAFFSWRTFRGRR